MVKSIFLALLICGAAAAGFLWFRFQETQQRQARTEELNAGVTRLLSALEKGSAEEVTREAAALRNQAKNPEELQRYRDTLERAYAERLRKTQVPNCHEALVLVHSLRLLYPRSVFGADVEARLEARRRQTMNILIPRFEAAKKNQDQKDLARITTLIRLTDPQYLMPGKAMAAAVPATAPTAAPVPKTVPEKVVEKPKPVPAPQVSKPARKARSPKEATQQLIEAAFRWDSGAVRISIAAGANPNALIREPGAKAPESLLCVLLRRMKSSGAYETKIPVVLELLKGGAALGEKEKALIVSLPLLAEALE